MNVVSLSLPAGRERDGRVRSDADMKIAGEILKSIQ